MWNKQPANVGEGFPNGDVKAVDASAKRDATKRLRDAVLAKMRRRPALAGPPQTPKVVGD